MHIEHGTKVSKLHFGEALVPQNTGVVDQDVDPAPLGHGLFDHVGDLVHVGNVGGVGHGFTPRGFYFPDDSQCRLTVLALTVDRASQVIDHHTGTSTGQLDGVTAPQTATCTRNYGYLAVIANRHILLLQKYR